MLATLIVSICWPFLRPGVIVSSGHALTANPHHLTHCVSAMIINYYHPYFIGEKAETQKSYPDQSQVGELGFNLRLSNTVLFHSRATEESPVLGLADSEAARCHQGLGFFISALGILSESALPWGWLPSWCQDSSKNSSHHSQIQRCPGKKKKKTG